MTIVVKLGTRFGQIYHFVLCLSAIALIAATLVMEQRFAGMLWVLLPTVLLIMHGLRVLRATDVKTLDPELKKLSLTTLLMSVLYVTAIIW